MDVTNQSGLGDKSSFSTSCLWFDYDRDGWLDLFVCNYVRWSPETDIFCSADGMHKSYCTPEAYHGNTCWLFRNRRDGTFEDVTAQAGLFDGSSKSLGVAFSIMTTTAGPIFSWRTILSRTNCIGTSGTERSRKLRCARRGV